MDGLTRGALSSLAVAPFSPTLNPDLPSSPMQNISIGIVIAVTALALIVVSIRVAARLWAKQFGLDDWLISIAMVISVAETYASYMCKSATIRQ